MKLLLLAFWPLAKSMLTYAIGWYFGRRAGLKRAVQVVHQAFAKYK